MDSKILVAWILPFIIGLFLTGCALCFCFSKISCNIIGSFNIQRPVLLLLFILVQMILYFKGLNYLIYSCGELSFHILQSYIYWPLMSSFKCNAGFQWGLAPQIIFFRSKFHCFYLYYGIFYAWNEGNSEWYSFALLFPV